MKRFLRARLVRCLLLLGSTLPMMALSCIVHDGIGPSVQSCPIEYENGWPTNATLSFSRPAHCPFRHGASLVPYAASITVPISSGIAYEFFQAMIEDRNGNIGAFIVNDVWTSASGNYYINASGDYYPASGGTDANGEGFDKIHNEIYNGQWIAAVVTLHHSIWADPLNLIGPATGLASGMEYQVNGIPHDPVLLAPLSWAWYVDGTYAGTTSDGSFSWTTGAPGTTQSIQTIITDANSETRSASTTARACPGAEIYC
jgi:hypothetical protein